MADQPIPPHQNDNKTNPEVFPEQESLKTSAEEHDAHEKAFQKTTTYENLQKVIPWTIEIPENEKTISTDTQLLERISNIKAGYNTNSKKFKDDFDRYNESFFPKTKFSSIPNQRKEFYMEQLAIIEACHDKHAIYLNPQDTLELCALLIPLVAKEQKTIKNDTEKAQELNETTKDFSDLPEYPTLLRMTEEWIISAQDFEEVQEYYWKNGSLSGIGEIEHLKIIEEYLSNAIANEPATIEENKNTFLADFPDAQASKETDNQSINIENDTTTRLIAENYIQFQTPWEAVHNRKKDYQMAVQTAKNKLLYEDHTVNRDSETFKKAVHNIEKDDSWSQYIWLKTIILLKQIARWKFEEVEEEKKKSRVEELLIKSHQQGQEIVKSNEAQARGITTEEKEPDPTHLLDDLEPSTATEKGFND